MASYKAYSIRYDTFYTVYESYNTYGTLQSSRASSSSSVFAGHRSPYEVRVLSETRLLWSAYGMIYVALPYRIIL